MDNTDSKKGIISIAISAGFGEQESRTPYLLNGVDFMAYSVICYCDDDYLCEHRREHLDKVIKRHDSSK